jgi:hypothetical protein
MTLGQVFLQVHQALGLHSSCVSGIKNDIFIRNNRIVRG